MEERKHLLDYLAQTMIVFGTTLLIITVICHFIGNEAKGYSTMFALGNAGIPVNTILQYLLSSILIMGFRFLFFTDTVIRKMTITQRTAAMLISTVALIGIFAYLFGWFPVDDPKCWLCFLTCFGICFVISSVVSTLKETMDNKQLEAALKNLKEEKTDNADRGK